MVISLNFILIFLLINIRLGIRFLSIDIFQLARAKVFQDHLKLIFSFFGLTNTIRSRVLKSIYQNCPIKILTSFHSHLIKAGSCHGSFLKTDMNWKMMHFFSETSWNIQFLRNGKTNFWLQWHQRERLIPKLSH